MLQPAATAATDRDTLGLEEARLARVAAAGDSRAFALLYGRYEQRVFNLAYRITGFEDAAADAVQDAFLNVIRGFSQLGDREPAFDSYLFTATRNACFDLLGKRGHGRPSEPIAQSAIPPSSGPNGRDPGKSEDPNRKVLPESQQEEIRAANMRLPERQREALALRELEELSYGEIAAIMETNRNTVAQLLSRARINLRDDLHGTALASIAAPLIECERALPLIAMRDDGQLEPASRDAGWLDAHLTGCHRCRLGVEAMQAAGASYRTWAPIAAPPWLLKETMARAAELVGADWSETLAETTATRDSAELQPGTPSAYLAGTGGGKSPRRRLALAASLTALLLLAGAGLAAVLTKDNPSATKAGAGADTKRRLPVKALPAGPKHTRVSKTHNAGASGARKKTTTRTTTVETTAAAAPATLAVPAGTGVPHEPASPATHSPGKTAVGPTRQTSTSKPSPNSTSAPAPTVVTQPSSPPATTPTTEEATPAVEEPSRRHEPPGKPPGRPPK
ncbi:MAG: sigma-70 family RNA polymerase sigma factor [Solirubrobacterales bacterium]